MVALPPTAMSLVMLSDAPRMAALEIRLAPVMLPAEFSWPPKLTLPTTPTPPMTCSAPVAVFVLSVPETNCVSLAIWLLATVICATVALM